MTADPTKPPAVWFPAVRAHSGADVFTQRLCAALNARGIRAEIAWLPLRAEYAPWSVPVPRPPTWANVVHVNSWLHPRFLPRGLPVITTVHHCVHDPLLTLYKSRAQALYHRLWIKRVENAMLNLSSRIVAVSRYTATAYENTFGISGIEVIHNGVDTRRYHPTERTSPNRPFRLLYVGNWIPRKGVDLLAPIMQALGDDFELVFTVDRSGAHKRYLLPLNCRNLGRLSDPALVAAYQQADALLFPSRLEGFGLVAAEAMACGLPVIAANTASLPEVIEQGVTGLLCPVDDVAAFADAARQLAQNPAQWLGMRRAARGRAERLFNASRLLSQWLDVYCSLFAHDAR